VETKRFDELTKLLSEPMPRRQVFKILVASILGGAFIRLGGDLALADGCPSGQTSCRNSSGKLICCPVGAKCVNKQCVCPTGQQVCMGDDSQPRCTSLSTDPKNCGKCGHVCPTGATCTSGVCKCPTGQVVCNNGGHGFCAKKCCAYNSDDCEEVPQQGSFSIAVPQTQIRLTGAGTPQSSGVMVSVAKVTMPQLGRNMHPFKLVATGHFPALKLASKGTLHHFNPATGTLKTIDAVRISGIYAAAF
jgi:hypothetical protein